MTDDIDAIVERLRDRQALERNHAAFGILPNDLYGKAATLIERQATTILELEARLERVESLPDYSAEIEQARRDQDLRDTAWDDWRATAFRHWRSKP